jgi:hypothetical protein
MIVPYIMILDNIMDSLEAVMELEYYFLFGKHKSLSTS